MKDFWQNMAGAYDDQYQLRGIESAKKFYYWALMILGGVGVFVFSIGAIVVRGRAALLTTQFWVSLVFSLIIFVSGILLYVRSKNKRNKEELF